MWVHESTQLKEGRKVVSQNVGLSRKHSVVESLSSYPRPEFLSGRRGVNGGWGPIGRLGDAVVKICGEGLEWWE